MIGTLAVILLLASFVGGSGLFDKFLQSKRRIYYGIIAGLIGGLFGMYGNISGVEFEGALITVRDMGPMFAGFMGGPVGGLIAGLIAGAHRLWIGGVTAKACIIATCCIGTVCGILSSKYHRNLVDPRIAFITGVVSEVFHITLLLIMVKPFQTALAIVKGIAVPFILVNALGFTLLIFMLSFMEKQRMMTIEQGRIQSDLETARVIQRSLLPPINEQYPARDEFGICGLMEPAKEVGGDFYDYFFLGKDKLCLVVADVSGKGIPAAMFMATSKQTLQSSIRDIPDLEEAVRVANNSMCSGNDADMFVTAWIGVVDLVSGEVEFISAGHNPPVVIKGGEASFIEQKSGFVLAGLEDIKYKKQKTGIEPGDILLLYTDGVTEAENVKHELFGDDRLLESCSKATEKDPDGVISTVREDIDSYVGRADQFDDITMLCVQLRS